MPRRQTGGDERLVLRYAPRKSVVGALGRLLCRPRIIVTDGRILLHAPSSRLRMLTRSAVAKQPGTDELHISTKARQELTVDKDPDSGVLGTYRWQESNATEPCFSHPRQSTNFATD